MKNFILSAAFASFISLGACGEISSDAENPEALPESLKAKAEQIESKVTADLSKMDIPEIIDYMNTESTDMTLLLKTVTDGPTAQVAIEDIRTTIPRINAAIRSLEKMDVQNMTLSIGNMRKMMKIAQSQSSLVNEVVRISKIPEARDILEKEFDKIEITNR